MITREFWRRNALEIIFTILFLVWVGYLLTTALQSSRIVYFHELMTSGTPPDVSSQYLSEVPLLRYFIEPFVGLTFTFSFNSDPTDILVLFIMLYAILRIGLLVIDNTILHKNKKKEVIFRYIKDVLEFVTKYASLLILVIAVVFLIALFTQGFLWIANHFLITLHLASFIGLFLLIGRAIYDVIIYYHPKRKLKIHIKSARNPIWKILIRIRRELFYFWTAFLLIFSMNFLFLGIQFPTQHITAIDLAPDEFLFDFHVHTTMSDGHLTPEERVMWYIDQGIHGAAFTDHHHPYGAMQAKAFVEANNLDFTVLIGQEFTDDPEGLHLNIFGIEEPIIPKNYYYEGPYHGVTMNVSEAIQYAKAHGGYVIVNHYERNVTAPFTYEQLRDWGVDGFEIRSGSKYREIYDFCINNGLIAIGSTDQHMNDELNEFVRLKLTDPTNKTLAHIFENLRRNNHSIVALSQPQPYDNFDDELEKLDDFSNYLYNLDPYQTLSWVFWSLLAYLLGILTIRRIRKTDLYKFQKNLEVVS
ncbi:MAG: PHP domain-containing protein [Candidatus Helarchaeota archaeon]